MPWEPVRSVINVAILLFLIPLFLASRVQAMDCSASSISVTKPEVKFMLYTSEAYILWESEPGLKNKYTLYYCCERAIAGMMSKCTSECPDYRQIVDCRTKKKRQSHLLVNQCRLLVNQQIHYTMYWNTTLHGCNFTSEVAQITPTVENGQWPAVHALTMEIDQPGQGLQMGWLHSYDYIDEGLCFFYTLSEIGGANISKVTKEFKVHMKFPPGSRPLKTYEFCIKVRLCDRTDAPYSEIVCKKSQIRATAPKNPPKWLCGGENNPCPTVTKNNLRNVTLLWGVSDNWNGIPKEIKLKVRDGENKMTEHVLNSSATNYTLTGLRTDSEYHVGLIRCSNGGCSGMSTPVVLPAIAMQEIKRSDKGVLVSPTFWAILVPCIILITSTAITCFLLEKRNTGNETVPLPHLQEPNVGGACSGNSVATSLYCNPNDYDRLRNDWSRSDTSSLGINENGYDSSSIGSFESASDRPLLSKASKIADSPENPRIMVTYLTHQRGTVSSLKPSASGDENPEFV